MEKAKSDIVKWAFVAFLLIGGITANYYYHEVLWSLRAIAGLFLMAVVLLLTFQTEQGKIAWRYVADARSELRRVVWPKRDEVVQVAFFVVMMVLMMVVILWVVDSSLMWLVSHFTGQEG